MVNCMLSLKNDFYDENISHTITGLKLSDSNIF